MSSACQSLAAQVSGIMPTQQSSPCMAVFGAAVEEQFTSRGGLANVLHSHHVNNAIQITLSDRLHSKSYCFSALKVACIGHALIPVQVIETSATD
jgi:hypothetical protein